MIKNFRRIHLKSCATCKHVTTEPDDFSNMYSPSYGEMICSAAKPGQDNQPWDDPEEAGSFVCDSYESTQSKGKK